MIQNGKLEERIGMSWVRSEVYCTVYGTIYGLGYGF